MMSRATGLEKSSYSLQYSQARLQRRIGMMCANTGWSVETSPLAIIFNSRSRRLQASTRRRTPDDDFGILNSFHYTTSDMGLGKRLPLFGEFPPASGVRWHPAVVCWLILALSSCRRGDYAHLSAGL